MPPHPLASPLSDLGFTIEVWDDADVKVVEVLAAARNSKVARKAYDVALETWPNSIVKLRQKALVVEAGYRTASRALTRPCMRLP